jgi:hypothetical protein
VPRRALSTLLVLVLVVPGAARAQAAEAADSPPPRLSASLTVGTLNLTDLQTQPVRAGRIGEAGEIGETALLVRTITGGSGRSASAALVIGLSPAWGLRVGGGLANARLGQGYAGPEQWMEDAREVPVAEDPDISILTLDSALRFRIPTERALRPYLEVGIAAERWRSSAALPAGDGNVEGLTRVGGQAAVGGDYPIGRGLALSLRATTRVFRTPLAPVVTGVEVGRTDTLVLTAEAPDASPFADTAVELVRGLRLDVGLSYRPGAAGAARPDRSEPNGSTSALRR